MTFKDRPYFRRILDFDDMMRRKEQVTYDVLAKAWETSPKTIQRFIKHMRLEFQAPIKFDPKRGSFCYTDETYRLPWLPVEGKDLFAIGVAQKVLQLYAGTPAAEDLAEIFQRLSELMPPEVRIRPSSVMESIYITPRPSRHVDREVWVTVEESLRDRTVLLANYQKPRGNPEWREIEPYNLVLAGSDWLLIGRDPKDEVVKTFYLNRIREAKRTETRYVIPKEFNIHDFFGDSIGIYTGGEPFRFRVRFSQEVSPWVSEVRWHPTQEMSQTDDGGVELELPGRSLWEARRFILSFGRHAVAVSPQTLVDEMCTEISAMAARYPRT